MRLTPSPVTPGGLTLCLSDASRINSISAAFCQTRALPRMAPITSLSALIFELGCVNEVEKAIFIVRPFQRRCGGSGLDGAAAIKPAKAFPATQVTKNAVA